MHYYSRLYNSLISIKYNWTLIWNVWRFDGELNNFLDKISRGEGLHDFPMRITTFGSIKLWQVNIHEGWLRQTFQLPNVSGIYKVQNTPSPSLRNHGNSFAEIHELIEAQVVVLMWLAVDGTSTRVWRGRVLTPRVWRHEAGLWVTQVGCFLIEEMLVDGPVVGWINQTVITHMFIFILKLSKGFFWNQIPG